MAHVLHLLPHPGGGGEAQHRLIAARLSEHRHELAAVAGRQELPWALPGLLFRRPFLAARVRRADLVHIDGDAAAILSRNVIGACPYVITTAGLHLLRRSTGARERAVRARLRERVLASRATMCTSGAELGELGALCGDAAPLALVRNGVPLPDPPSEETRAAARAELGLSEDETLAVMLARLETRKRPLEAARAAIAARRAGALLTLVVAGDGPLRGELDALAGPAVRVLGFRHDPERLLGAADLFVLVSEREGLSLGLLEAMGHGLPAVVSDGPGNPEAVGDDAGVVIGVGDEAALAEAMRALAADPARRRALGAAARARVQREFSVEQMAAGVAEAYRRGLA